MRIALLLVPVAALEGACRSGWFPPTVIVAPSVMVTTLIHLFATGVVYQDFLTSFLNVAIAALAAIVLGFALGAIIHAVPIVRDALEPFLASYYAVPTFMFYPVFIILFGVGSVAIVGMAITLAIVAMITATLNGLDRIPPVLRKTARMFEMGKVETALKISLPAAMPYLFTGIKLSVAYALIGVIASEFILSGSGLGYSIAYAYNNFDNADMYALMLLIIVVVSLTNAMLDVVDRKLQARLSRT